MTKDRIVKSADAVAIDAYGPYLGDSGPMVTCGGTDFHSQRYRRTTRSDNSFVLLARDGATIFMRASVRSHPSHQDFSLIMQCRNPADSLIGGVSKRRARLDFHVERGVFTDTEMIRADHIPGTYERLLVSTMKYRFVIDCTALAA